MEEQRERQGRDDGAGLPGVVVDRGLDTDELADQPPRQAAGEAPQTPRQGAGQDDRHRDGDVDDQAGPQGQGEAGVPEARQVAHEGDERDGHQRRHAGEALHEDRRHGERPVADIPADLVAAENVAPDGGGEEVVDEEPDEIEVEQPHEGDGFPLGPQQDPPLPGADGVEDDADQDREEHPERVGLAQHGAQFVAVDPADEKEQERRADRRFQRGRGAPSAGGSGEGVRGCSPALWLSTHGLGCLPRYGTVALKNRRGVSLYQKRKKMCNGSLSPA